MLVNLLLHIENTYACTPCKIHLTKEMGKTSTMYLLMQPVDQRCIRNFGNGYFTSSICLIIRCLMLLGN